MEVAVSRRREIKGNYAHCEVQVTKEREQLLLGYTEGLKTCLAGIYQKKIIQEMENGRDSHSVQQNPAQRLRQVVKYAGATPTPES
ncbi:unnamed protein product [Pleuronectes platessa]|uniref:Uncharacterized protein n=1 Tax=Pleuronectes platessa TaxID=8262 RepID=A0A9N7VNX9_PLEPL|nr:unnamed protein product [Pleuronectes platessa]